MLSAWVRSLCLRRAHWAAVGILLAACGATSAKLSDVDAVTDSGAATDVPPPFDLSVTDVVEVFTDVTAVDVAQAVPDADDVTSGCLAVAELCDGADNDCDGLTDEDFTVLSPSGPVPLGSPCGKGKIVCVSLTKADCSVPMPGNAFAQVDQTAVLSPADAAPSPLTATGAFVDVTAQTPASQMPVYPGEKAQVPNGSTPLALDVDGDGDLDLVWYDDVNAVRLWTQTQPWQFEATIIQSGNVGIASLAALSDGVTTDILIGGNGVSLLERAANGKFVDVAAARGLVVPAGTQIIRHLLPADVNADGVLDVVAGVFSCSPLYPAHYVWLGRGDGHFVEAAAALGFDLHASIWASFCTDFDSDGWADLLSLTESCEPAPGVGLFHNQAGAPGAMFALQSAPPVFSAPAGGGGSPMGGDVADVNGDGVLDYLFTQIELHDYVASGGDPKNLKVGDPKLLQSVSNQFLLSQPDGSRKLAGLQAGLWAPLGTNGMPMTAWSAVWTDLDHDGHLDLLLSHGSEYFAWTSGAAGTMRPVFFRNDGTQHFTDLSASFKLPAQHDGRTLLAADLDGDGDDDLVLGGQGIAPRVLRNDLIHGGTDVRVRLRGQASNPWGLMARVSLKTNLRTLLMEHSVHSVPQSMGVPESHFSLQVGEKPQSLNVTWPSGWVSQQALTAPGPLEVVEPALFALSTRWSPKGTVPVTVQATHFGAGGTPQGPANCTIALAAGSKGQWQGPTTCQGATCTRTWIGTPASQQGADTVEIGCGGQTWKVRPRISY